MLSPGQEFPKIALPGAAQNIVGLPDAAVGRSWKLCLFLKPDPGPIGAIEFNYLVHLRASFDERGIQALGVISDQNFFHSYFNNCAKREIAPPFTVIDDSEGALGKAAGVLASHRAAFLIDPAHVVRYVCSHDAAYPMNVFSILSIYDMLLLDPASMALQAYRVPSGSRPS